MTFVQWMALVNQAILLEVGVTADDLPDRPYRDQYEDGVTPQEAAAEALEYAGYDPS